jgi:hypothetical protein
LIWRPRIYVANHPRRPPPNHIQELPVQEQEPALLAGDRTFD